MKYLNEDYFKIQFEEDRTNESFKTYPVQLKGIDFEWIRAEQGQQYLNAIFNSEHIELYGSEANYMIIEYLYKYHRKYVVLWSTPELLLQLFLYFTLVYALEAKEEAAQGIVAVVRWLYLILGVVAILEASHRFGVNFMTPKVNIMDQILVFQFAYGILVCTIGVLLIKEGLAKHLTDSPSPEDLQDRQQFIMVVR